MTLRTCDGALLRRAVAGAAGTLARHVAEVDALNVFPVPDGDTGRNLLATIRAAAIEAERTTSGRSPASDVADALARGALLGARGNSGVILSQVLRGMATAADGKRRVGGRELAAGLLEGSRRADRAVARPVEGTMLSVVRAAAEAAMATAAHDDRIEVVLSEAVEAAAAAVERTPEQLAVLREAGVVDAGGRGVELLLRGTLAALAEEDWGAVRPAGAAATPGSAAVTAGEDGYGYETAYLLAALPGRPLDIDALRATLDPLGDSLLVVGDEAVARVHIHGARPDLALAVGLDAGHLSRVTIENLDRLAEGDREERVEELLGAGPHAGRHDAHGEHARGGGARPAAAGLHASGPSAAPPARPAVRGTAVVAVAYGDGLAAVLAAAGAIVVRPTPGHERPSTGELLDAVRAAGDAAAIILPNDPNVHLAARQVVSLAGDAWVRVVPTRTVQEGIAAVLAADPRLDADANATRMAAAAGRVRSIAVTEAARDARIDGRQLRRGQAIAVDPDERIVAAGDDRIAVAGEAVAAVAAGAELVTIHYGAAVPLAEALALGERLERALPGVAVEVTPGGQPHPAFLVGVE